MSRIQIFMNEPQLMWLDIIHALIRQPKFNLKIGDLNYVFRNMIAKFVSSAEIYHVSAGVEALIDGNPELKEKVINGEKINLKNYFYGGKSYYASQSIKTLFEHSIPAAVIRDELVLLREKIFSSDMSLQESFEKTKNVLLHSGFVVVVLKEENQRLLRKSMPDGWVFGADPFDRYAKATPTEVVVSEKYRVKRDAHICR